MRINQIFITLLLSTLLFSCEQDDSSDPAESIMLEVTKDAMIRKLDGVGDNTNYGDYEFLNMHAWTNKGDLVIHRSLLDFDLPQLPEGVTIARAQLLLYSDANTNGMFSGGHQKLSGSNESIISRVTSSWEEFEVTWDAQPSITNSSQTIVAESQSDYQSYEVDVTELLQEMLDNRDNSFGFMMQLTNESHYRRMVFASSNNVDPSIHPRLEITLSLEVSR